MPSTDGQPRRVAIVTPRRSAERVGGIYDHTLRLREGLSPFADVTVVSGEASGGSDAAPFGSDVDW